MAGCARRRPARLAGSRRANQHTRSARATRTSRPGPNATRSNNHAPGPEPYGNDALTRQSATSRGRAGDSKNPGRCAARPAFEDASNPGSALAPPTGVTFRDRDRPGEAQRGFVLGASSHHPWACAAAPYWRFCVLRAAVRRVACPRTGGDIGAVRQYQGPLAADTGFEARCETLHPLRPAARQRVG
jgi:hypothetical protein